MLTPAYLRVLIPRSPGHAGWLDRRGNTYHNSGLDVSWIFNSVAQHENVHPPIKALITRIPVLRDNRHPGFLFRSLPRNV